jgi:hypothetical protein
MTTEKKNAKATRAPRVQLAQLPPAMWDANNWPKDVWPHDSKTAQWLLRAYRRDLLYHRALTRVGKKLVVFGDGWMQWLQSRAGHVEGYKANNALPPGGGPRAATAPDS